MNSPNTGSDEATVALEQGKRLLRRNEAAQAFTQLQAALKLFTGMNDQAGIAATKDALGDVYTQNGQYAIALTHYRSAYEHFATHGLLNAERPQFTGLILSLVGEASGDGFLRANEIFNFRLGSPLVMLSACETGLGREKRGEGVIGLTRAFMYAGAPTVGVSLWSVSDRSTAQLMTDFYKGLFTNKGRPPSGAMREAQLKMISASRYSAPFFWAPFVLVGDWL